MKKIELKVLWHSDNTKLLEDLDIKVEDSEYEHRLMTFYQILAISPNRSYSKEYTNIHISGDSFICPLPYEKVSAILDKELFNL